MYPEMVFTTLAHHLDVAMLERAFWKLNPHSSPGIDRVTWQAYERDLEENLEVLHEELVSKTYRPMPVVRRWIPKSNGKLRPLGLPALADKIVQRAVATLLEQIYEADFCEFSYGFRPGRKAHDALHASRQGLLSRVHCVIDCDISSFFDNLQHDELLAILRKRVNDGRLLQLIEMWLVAVIGCEREEDARRIMEVLPKRFGKYGLQINTEKTKLVNFRRPRWGQTLRRHDPKPDTFSFLGFTHYWGKTWKGGYTIKRKTEGKRMFRSIRMFWEWCRDHRHRSLEQQYATLCAKLRGYYQYYGLRCNSKCLDLVCYHATRAWRYWLNRRGGRKKLSWQKFEKLLEAFPLPQPKIMHPEV